MMELVAWDSLSPSKYLRYILVRWAHPAAHSAWRDAVASRPQLRAHLVRDPSIFLRHLRAYVCRSWSVRKRVERLCGHYDELAHWLPPAMAASLANSGAVTLCEWTCSQAEYTISFEAGWRRTREGDLVLCLHRNGDLLFRVAMTVSTDAVYLSCVQGPKGDHRADRVKLATRELNGVRPRCLLLHGIRVIAGLWGGKTIFGVSNLGHPFKHRKAAMVADYDQIWKSYGGIVRDRWWYQLPIERVPRDLAALPSRKRAMHRRREATLAQLEGTLRRRLACGPIREDRPLHAIAV